MASAACSLLLSCCTLLHSGLKVKDQYLCVWLIIVSSRFCVHQLSWLSHRFLLAWWAVFGTDLRGSTAGSGKSSPAPCWSGAGQEKEEAAKHCLSVKKSIVRIQELSPYSASATYVYIVLNQQHLYIHPLRNFNSHEKSIKTLSLPINSNWSKCPPMSNTAAFL